MRVPSWLAVTISVLLLVAVGVIGVVVNRSALRAADTVHRSDSLPLAANNAALAGQLQQLAAEELKSFTDGYPFDLDARSAGDRTALNSFVSRAAFLRHGAAITALDGRTRWRARCARTPLRCSSSTWTGSSR